MYKIKLVLFVCLGNTARSPAAEYLARYHAKKLGIDLKFDSCGFFNAFSYMQLESRDYLDSKGNTSSKNNDTSGVNDSIATGIRNLDSNSYFAVSIFLKENKAIN
ncbi:MAG: hypothetical protein ACFE8N_01930 [Promethearchaeota archaeon]